MAGNGGRRGRQKPFRSSSRGGSPVRPSRGLPELAHPRPGELKPSPAERRLRGIMALVKQHTWSNREELQDYLNGLAAAGDLPEAHPATPEEQAQDLAYRAWEAEGAARAGLARQALDVHADCADAHLILALEATDREEAESRLRAAV